MAALPADNISSARPSAAKTCVPAGDLVFFRPRSGNRVGHVGIVTEADGQGNFKFIHASIKGVKITNFEGTNYYTARYIGARRLL